MKIRTDFVTNSSSSNFALEILVETKDGLRNSLSFYTWDDNSFEYFEDNLINIFDADTGKLEGRASSVEGLAQYLVDNWYHSYTQASHDDYCRYWEKHAADELNGNSPEDDQDDIEEYGEKAIEIFKGIHNAKADFKSWIIKNVHSIEDVAAIVVRTDYYGCGEFGMHIIERDSKLRELAKKVIAANGDEEAKAIREMREYLSSENVKENIDPDYLESSDIYTVIDCDKVYYDFDLSDSKLQVIAEELTQGWMIDDDVTIIQKIDLRKGTFSDYAEIRFPF